MAFKATSPCACGGSEPAAVSIHSKGRHSGMGESRPQERSSRSWEKRRGKPLREMWAEVRERFQAGGGVAGGKGQPAGRDAG